jgi:hypothetical protein
MAEPDRKGEWAFCNKIKPIARLERADEPSVRKRLKKRGMGILRKRNLGQRITHGRKG